MEKIPIIPQDTLCPEKEDPGVSPEKEVSFECNDAEVLLDRVSDPVIKNQIIDIVLEHKQKTAEQQRLLVEDTWDPFLPEGWDGSETTKLVKGKRTGKVLSVPDLEQLMKRAIPVPTRNSVEQELDATISQVQRITEIDFTTDSPHAWCIPLNWHNPHTREKPTAKQMSVVEAHEKGHRVRPYHSSADTNRFIGGFDRSKAEFTEADFDAHKWGLESETNKVLGIDRVTREGMRDSFFDYLFSEREIAERMSQLKNYFGFRGNQTFTKEHLRYAKEHYIPDIGLDNGMRQFFQAITPETEDAFIELINSSGI